jgi:hypothetical protein
MNEQSYIQNEQSHIQNQKSYIQNQKSYIQSQQPSAIDVRRYQLEQEIEYKNSPGPQYDVLSSEEDHGQAHEELIYEQINQMRKEPKQMYNPYDDGSQDDNQQIGKYLVIIFRT